MRRLVTSVATLALSTSIAAAGPEPAVRASRGDEKIAVALAVNNPVMWNEAESIGVSGYIAFKARQAIRFNVANFRYHCNLAGSLLSLLNDGDGAVCTGRITDVGIGWQYFPRSVWSGFSIELGGLRRSKDIREEDYFALPEVVATDITGYAARAMLGWSWLGWKRVFLATALGASVGRYAGTESIAQSSYDPDGNLDYMTKDIARIEIGVEAYLRLGVAFGL